MSETDPETPPSDTLEPLLPWAFALLAVLSAGFVVASVGFRAALLEGPRPLRTLPFLATVGCFFSCIGYLGVPKPTETPLYRWLIWGLFWANLFLLVPLSLLSMV